MFKKVGKLEMLKKQLVIVLFSLIVALIAWVLAAYFWVSKRFWLPEISEPEKLLIGLTIPINIAIFIVVFFAIYAIISVLAFKVKPSKQGAKVCSLQREF